MISPPDVSRQFRRALDASRRGTQPYRHWLLDQALPDAVCDDIVGLPLTPPVVLETYGKRETNNASRSYFAPTLFPRHPVTELVAKAFQAPETTGRIEAVCGIRLAGSLLRIEYCQDQDGFWLEPHTDIGVKRFTMLIYLSQGPESETWGTDILDGPDRLVATVPSRFNSALTFLPANDTWHSFHRRAIAGIRRTIIVNYVEPEWRSRHELAFPNAPIAATPTA
jgi:hypothetical protein